MPVAPTSLTHEIVVSNIPFSISEKNVLRELRIPVLQSLMDLPQRKLAQYIKKAIDTAYPLIEGKGIYRTFPIQRKEEGGLVIAGSESLFTGESIVRLLAPCAYGTVFAATIGPALEKRVEELKAEHPADAYYLDGVGGWMAEYMAGQIDKRIELEVYKSGYGRTRRFSPGYGDWDLSCQKEMIRLTRAEGIGITLTESFIMIPRKSVTAVIGWQKKE